MTQCCLILILLFYVKEDYNHRSVDDKDDTVLPQPHPSILCKGRLQQQEEIRLTIRMTQDDTAQPHPSILCKGRLQPQEG